MMVIKHIKSETESVFGGMKIYIFTVTVTQMIDG